MLLQCAYFATQFERRCNESALCACAAPSHRPLSGVPGYRRTDAGHVLLHEAAFARRRRAICGGRGAPHTGSCCPCSVADARRFTVYLNRIRKVTRHEQISQCRKFEQPGGRVRLTVRHGCGRQSRPRSRPATSMRRPRSVARLRGLSVGVSVRFEGSAIGNGGTGVTLVVALFGAALPAPGVAVLGSVREASEVGVVQLASRTLPARQW